MNKRNANQSLPILFIVVCLALSTFSGALWMLLARVASKSSNDVWDLYNLFEADPHKSYEGCPKGMEQNDGINRANLRWGSWVRITDDKRLVLASDACPIYNQSLVLCQNEDIKNTAYLYQTQPKKEWQLKQIRDKILDQAHFFHSQIELFGVNAESSQSILKIIGVLGYEWIKQSQTIVSLSKNLYLGNCYEEAIWNAYRKVFKRGWGIANRLHLIDITLPNGDDHVVLYLDNVYQTLGQKNITMLGDLDGKIIDPYFKKNALRKYIDDENYLSLSVKNIEPVMHLAPILYWVKQLPDVLQNQVLELLNPYPVPDLSTIFCQKTPDLRNEIHTEQIQNEQAYILEYR